MKKKTKKQSRPLSKKQSKPLAPKSLDADRFRFIQILKITDESQMTERGYDVDAITRAMLRRGHTVTLMHDVSDELWNRLHKEKQVTVSSDTFIQREDGVLYPITDYFFGDQI